MSPSLPTKHILAFSSIALGHMGHVSFLYKINPTTCVLHTNISRFTQALLSSTSLFSLLIINFSFFI